MHRSLKIVAGVIFILAILSISATFYKTVILQDIEMTGVLIEFPSENNSYVWFIYDKEEYELELGTTDFQEILAAVASGIGVPEANLNKAFLEDLETAYIDAKVAGTSEEEPPEEMTGIEASEEADAVTVETAEEVSEENISNERKGNIKTENTDTTSTETLIISI